MPIYKPSELRQFLDSNNLSPKKGLSQNFLIDGNIIKKIIDTAQVETGDIVLEIGPGPGSLTEALLEKGVKLLAVEKDVSLANTLERFQTEDRRLSVYCEDILTFPIHEKFSSLINTEKKGKVIANLPYHLTTPIVTQLSRERALFSSLTIMVQDEMGRRMTAQPNTNDYGSLTVFLRFYTNPRYAFTVSQHCFYPVPKVNSAIVYLELKEPPLDEDTAVLFFKMTRQAFEHRRKMLRASLKEMYPSHAIEEALEKIGQNRLARPEVLSLEEFLELFHLLQATLTL
ncbi:MAG: 16S rRNA (adenine(1518)-N(6)/adenine(1519)-N(6))-dimethyltransferase RsmA [Parachlamydiaceae bacterium]|nr:16S rRNA (adenine(1518)-N(6)/adenine(1519)-N(6))-dimethyltransferase RsmA [Parachlamydiaceae bacterium]